MKALPIIFVVALVTLALPVAAQVDIGVIEYRAATDTDGDGTPNATDTDDDNDGVSDADETTNGTNPLLADTDGDGADDGAEGTTDTDGDGTIDALESATADADNDGVNDQADSANNDGSNDTDGDGVSNADEVAAGTDPADANDTPTTTAPTPVPAMPTWATALIAALVALVGFVTARTHRGAARLFTVAAVGIVITAGATLFRSGPALAQQSYACGNFAMVGTVNITNANATASNFQYDPSKAIEACAQTLVGSYAGLGTLSANAQITFTVTNSSGIALELDPARFNDQSLTTSVDNYQAGGRTFHYTNVAVTPSNVQSQCGDLLQDGASCEVTVDVATTGDLEMVTTASLSQSTVSVSDSVIDDAGSTTVAVQLVDAQGQNLSGSDGTVVVTATNSATVSAVTDNGDGSYSATVTAASAGTISVSATLNGNALTSTATVEAAAIQVRFSAKATSTINGGSPTSGSVLTSWNDTTGTVTSSSIIGDPTYTTNGVVFDGNDGVVTSATALFASGTDDLTFVYVASPASVSDQAFILFQEHTNCSTNVELGIDTGWGSGSGNVGLHRGCYEAVVSPAGTVGTSGGHVVVTRVLGSGTTPSNVKMDVDGSAVTVTADDGTVADIAGWLDAGAYPTGSAALQIAHRQSAGYPAGAFFSGTLHELIVFSNALTDAEVAKISAALANEYGL